MIVSKPFIFLEKIQFFINELNGYHLLFFQCRQTFYNWLQFGGNSANKINLKLEVSYILNIEPNHRFCHLSTLKKLSEYRLKIQFFIDNNEFYETITKILKKYSFLIKFTQCRETSLKIAVCKHQITFFTFHTFFS